MPNPLYDRLFARHTDSSAIFLQGRPDADPIRFGQFVARGAQFAHVLSNAGLVAGDRLIVQVPKSSDALALYAACVQTGVILVPLNTAYTATELAYFLADTEARHIVIDPDKTQDLAPCIDTAKAQSHSLGASGGGTLAMAADAAPTTYQTTDRRGSDLAALLYTSGTTGRSKGAMLSQDNLLSNAQTLTDLWGFTAQDVLLHALPIFHTHGLFVATNVALLAGASLILQPRFDPDAVFDALPQATSLMGVPTFYTRLLDDPRLTRAATRHMRLFISGSAPMLAETHRDWQARTGHTVLERYGMTETNMSTSNPLTGTRKPGTVGLPLPGVDLRLTDPDTGAEVPDGDIGQIEVRGPNVCQGYWRMPDKTRAEFRDDGFFLTGDLATRDPDGYITIVGRAKDLIISGGYNIYPKEVEEVIDALPGVLESAVVAAPHPDLGEGAVAVVAAQPDSGLTTDSLERALDNALARFKHPRAWRIVPALPRNTMGKVQKAVLREQHKDIFA